MTREVKSHILLELVDRAEIARAARFAQLLERGVGPVDVGLVVLAVVQLEDLTGQMGLQGRVVVGEFGQFVLRHRSSWGHPIDGTC